MRIWFDTEFLEDGHTIKLISIGMVREDGHTYYRETADAKWLVEESDWLRENVKPHLKHCTAWPNSYIGKEIVAFAGPNPEFWAYYASYDWVALCQLFGTMMDLPEGWPMFVRDVQQWRSELGNPDMPAQDNEHDALADALWTKAAWERLAAMRAKAA
jgi:hypothetical protein